MILNPDVNQDTMIILKFITHQSANKAPKTYPIHSVKTRPLACLFNQYKAIRDTARSQEYKEAGLLNDCTYAAADLPENESSLLTLQIADNRVLFSAVLVPYSLISVIKNKKLEMYYEIIWLHMPQGCSHPSNWL